MAMREATRTASLTGARKARMGRSMALCGTARQKARRRQTLSRRTRGVKVRRWGRRTDGCASATRMSAGVRGVGKPVARRLRPSVDQRESKERGGGTRETRRATSPGDSVVRATGTLSARLASTPRGSRQVRVSLQDRADSGATMRRRRTSAGGRGLSRQGGIMAWYAGPVARYGGVQRGVRIA